MNITTYKQEVLDGVADLVLAERTIAYCTEAHIVCEKQHPEQASEMPEALRKIIAKSNPDQVDLYYLESVLVSTGWNKIDDVFDVEEVWSARNTPEDKQFNFMHDENDIIGHITDSYVLDKSGNRIDADEQNAPKEFDIITEAVLYNSWQSPENRDRMRQIIAEITEGKWFVSMECLFAGFDYALIDPQGGSKIVKRDEESAFLTKHLRSYGGTGEYEGYKVGRALRGISFSGKGLVSKPANPRSVIFSSSKAFTVNNEDIVTQFSIGDVTMSENLTLLEKQLADLQNDLAEAKEENKALQKNAEHALTQELASTTEAFEADIASKDEAIAGLEETVKTTQARIAELEDELATKNEELSNAVQSINDMHRSEKMRKRLATLVEAGFGDDEAEESLALYDALDDEAFEGIVNKWITKKDENLVDAADKAGYPPNCKEGFVEKDGKCVPAVKAETVDEENTEEAEAEVSEEVFDEVESTEATLIETEEEDALQTTRAGMAEWISENFLSSGK